jgi:hypothetical protein
MKTRMSLFILLFMLPGGFAFARVGDGQESFRRSYRILLERNIFSQDRRAYVPERERPVYKAPPPPPIESTLLLTGISRQRGQTLAFIENTATGRIERHALSSPIARGRIQSLTLDFLVYARESEEGTVDPNADPNAPVEGKTPPPPQLTKVWIGQTLMGEGSTGSQAFTGSIGTESFAAPTTGPSQTQDDSTTPADSGEQSDILKRLLERRRQELGN